DRVIDYVVGDVSTEGVATVKGVYRKFVFHAKALFNDSIQPEEVDILWEGGEYRKKSEHRIYSGLVDEAVRAGVELKVDRRGRARISGSAPAFRNLEIWGAGQLLGLPGCLPEEPIRPEQAWTYAGKLPPSTLQGTMLRSEADVAVLSMKLHAVEKQASNELLEMRYDGEILVRFDAKRGLPREMKGTCRQSFIRNGTTTALDVPGSDVQVQATITPPKYPLRPQVPVRFHVARGVLGPRFELPARVDRDLPLGEVGRPRFRLAAADQHPLHHAVVRRRAAHDALRRRRDDRRGRKVVDRSEQLR